MAEENKNPEDKAGQKNPASSGSGDSLTIDQQIEVKVLENAKTQIAKGNDLSALGLVNMILEENPEHSEAKKLYDDIESRVNSGEETSAILPKRNQRCIQFTENFENKKDGDVEIYPSMLARTLVDQGVASFYDPVKQMQIKDTHPIPPGTSDGMAWNKMKTPTVQNTVNGLNDLDVLTRGLSLVNRKKDKEIIQARIDEINGIVQEAEELEKK